MISRKVKLALAISGIGMVLVGCTIGIWILWSGSNTTAQKNKIENVDLAVLAKSASTPDGNKPQTRGNVPLFQLPWKQNSDELTLQVDAKPAQSNDLAKANTGSAPSAVLPSGINNQKSQNKTATASLPGGSALGKSTAVQKLPFGSSSSKGAVPLQFAAGGGSTATLAPKNEIVRGKALMPVLQDNATQDPKELLSHYFQQVCGDRKPGLADWQILAKSRPQELKQFLDLPFGDGHFVMSLCQDIYGRVWIGTEGEGVWCWDPVQDASKQWRHFTRKNTGGLDEPNGVTSDAGTWLGDDNAYALACDKLGRIWVGHLNHGVSVFNGEKWQNYGVIEGPIGERIFAIATSPIDGDVWIATSAGLTRYSLSKDEWSYYTRAEGLSSDQANALTFANDGTLYVGTQCDGIAIAKLDDNYTSWRIVRGAESLPLTSKGSGLPTNLINDVFVTEDGTVYAATIAGLAWSRDCGVTWTFIRGRNWAAKTKGLFCGPPIGWSPDSNGALADDFITHLAQGVNETICYGTRQNGWGMIDLKYGLRVEPPSSIGSYVVTILPCKKTMLIGAYGDGISVISFDESGDDRKNVDVMGRLVVSHPNSARGSVALITPKNKESRLVNESKQSAYIIALNDDWCTQGDWRGRYGKYWACICAIDSPNYIWGIHANMVEYRSQISPRLSDSDSIRYWIQTLYTTDHRCLELPPTYLKSRINRGLTTPEHNRRDAAMDDHGEVYNQNNEGPDIFYSLDVPSGNMMLSLYFLNSNGHRGATSMRDYRVSIRRNSSESLVNIDDFDRQPELAYARVQNFYGGVYKRFIVCGPLKLTIQISRNYSFNTMLAGVFLDYMQDPVEPYFLLSGHHSLPQAANLPGSLPWYMLDQQCQTYPDFWAFNKQYIAMSTIRYLLAADIQQTSLQDKNRMLANCFYHLNQFGSYEMLLKQLRELSPRQIEEHLADDLLEFHNLSNARLAKEYVRYHEATADRP